MGVRLYNPALGRFLSVDPVRGGSANGYEYCNADSVNCEDLDGKWGRRRYCRILLNWCLTFNRRTHRSYWRPHTAFRGWWGSWWSAPYSFGLFAATHRWAKHADTDAGSHVPAGYR
jgi:hypothetical protein